jgi:hypothetical protein
VHNAGESVRDYRIRVDAEALGLAGELEVMEMMSGERTTVVVDKGSFTLTGNLDPLRTKVFRIQ